MKATHDVYALGNAIVDLQVRVEHAFLEELGLVPGSMTLVDHARQEEVLAAVAGRPVSSSSGGSAANTAAGLAELGSRAAFSGKVGDDELGAFFVEDLRRLGVAVAGSPLALPTGTCLVLITPDAQRTMLTHLGASSQLGSEDVDEGVLSRSKWCYVEGYLLPGTPTRDAAIHAIGLAKEHSVLVALTASDAFCVKACGDLFWDLLEESVDLFFCNEAEAVALTGVDDPVKAGSMIHERSAATVALTHGANGSVIVDHKRVHPIEGVRVNAVDTTGAGDMYAAGVLHGITHGKSWTVAGRLASHAASMVVASMGARLPRKLSADEVRELCEA